MSTSVNRPANLALADESWRDFPCDEWPHRRDHEGYGITWYDGKRWRVPRLAWTLERGWIPPGLLVCHFCDNPPCYEIEHLWLGTDADNLADMVAKGRDRHPGTRGEQHGHAKLTWKQVVKIRKRYAAGGITQRELGVEYGVSQFAISCIVRGKAWKAA